MKIVNKSRFYIGISIVLFLVLSYFVNIDVDSGANYTVTDTLLGIIIFHNLYVFILYLIVSLFFIVTGIKRIKFS